MASSSYRGPGVKTLALFFASLTAAKPLYPQLMPRQDAGNVTAVPAVTPAPSTSTSASAAASAAVTGTATTATLSGTQRICSVDSVTAFTSTEFMTLPSTTSALYTLELDPTIGCTCNDGWMAGVGTSMGDDGLQTLTCQFGDDENPAIATQTSAMVPNPTYVPEWCETIDTNDPDELVNMWENKNVSIVLDHWTNGKGDDWLKNFVQHALPDKGDVGYGGCGVIGGSCDFNLDCASMVEQAMGAEYWILKAVEGFHDKLQVAHEFLQDTTIDNILSIDTIASDFSAPKSTGMNELSMIASLLSAGIFLGGSVTGVVGAVAAEAKIAAEAAKVAAQAAARRALAGNNVAMTNKMDGIAAAAEKAESLASGTTRVTGALGAGLWTTASTFTMISAFSDPEGQVDSEDLTPLLQQMFKGARDQIEALGSLAMGRGGDYSGLPGADGSGWAPALDEESYIARFFSDGKFLLSESNPTFNDSIHDSYGTFRSKIVDQALQTGGMQVFALTDLDNEEECLDDELWGGYGAQWMDPLGDGTFYCMKMMRDNHGGGCGALTSCDWVAPEDDIFNKLQESYGFNMANYYAAAVQCNKAGLEDNIPDYTTMQADGVTPACYYNIKAQKAKKYQNCHGRDSLLCDSGYTLSDF